MKKSFSHTLPLLGCSSLMVRAGSLHTVLYNHEQTAEIRSFEQHALTRSIKGTGQLHDFLTPYCQWDFCLVSASVSFSRFVYFKLKPQHHRARAFTAVPHYIEVEGSCHIHFHPIRMLRWVVLKGFLGAAMSCNWAGSIWSRTNIQIVGDSDSSSPERAWISELCILQSSSSYYSCWSYFDTLAKSEFF